MMDDPRKLISFLPGAGELLSVACGPEPMAATIERRMTVACGPEPFLAEMQSL